MKSASILIIFTLAFYGCAQKKPQVEESFTTIKCEMFCDGNKCNQKCVGVKGKQ